MNYFFLQGLEPLSRTQRLLEPGCVGVGDGKLSLHTTVPLSASPCFSALCVSRGLCIHHPLRVSLHFSEFPIYPSLSLQTLPISVRLPVDVSTSVYLYVLQYACVFVSVFYTVVLEPVHVCS